MIQLNANSNTWKGATVAQMMPSLRLNQPSESAIGLYRAVPLRHYRREINQDATATIYTVPRSNIQISTYPGHSTITAVSTTADDPNRVEYTETLDYPANSSEFANAGNSFGIDTAASASYTDDIVQVRNPCMSVSQNAKTRVRTSGNMKNTYCNSSSQYLRTRNKTFAQNSVQFLNYCNNGNACVVASPENNYTDGRYINGKYTKYCADSASTRTLKAKYDTITCAAANTSGSFGCAVANELAYSSNTSAAYTLKTKTGYPLTTYPSFSQFSGEQTTSCSTVRG
jgi:hypothetical protein